MCKRHKHMLDLTLFSSILLGIILHQTTFRIQKKKKKKNHHKSFVWLPPSPHKTPQTITKQQQTNKQTNRQKIMIKEKEKKSIKVTIAGMNSMLRNQPRAGGEVAVHFCPKCLLRMPLAVSSASAAATGMCGATPAPSQAGPAAVSQCTVGMLR